MQPLSRLAPADAARVVASRDSLRRSRDSRQERLSETSTCLFSSEMCLEGGLSCQSRADRLAEALGIRWPFRQDDVVMDEKGFLNVLRAGVFQFLDRLREKINSRFAAREEFRLGEHNGRKANRGNDLAGRRHRCDEFMELLVVPEEFRYRRAAAKHQAYIIVRLCIRYCDIRLGGTTLHAAADPSCGGCNDNGCALVLENLSGFKEFFISELSGRNHNKNCFSIQLHIG